MSAMDRIAGRRRNPATGRFRRDSAVPIRHGQVPLTTRLLTAIIVHRQLLVR